MTNEGRETKFQILVVEDNPGDVYLLRLALQHAEVPFDLTVVEDGEQALTLIRSHDEANCVCNVHLAVLDLNLPKYSGVEILQAIRASSTWSAVPIVILSSSSSPRDMERIQQSGVSRFITKPADLKQFLNIGHTLKGVLAETHRKD